MFGFFKRKKVVNISTSYSDASKMFKISDGKNTVELNPETADYPDVELAIKTMGFTGNPEQILNTFSLAKMMHGKSSIAELKQTLGELEELEKVMEENVKNMETKTENTASNSSTSDPDMFFPSQQKEPEELIGSVKLSEELIQELGGEVVFNHLVNEAIIIMKSNDTGEIVAGGFTFVLSDDNNYLPKEGSRTPVIIGRKDEEDFDWNKVNPVESDKAVFFMLQVVQEMVKTREANTANTK